MVNALGRAVPDLIVMRRFKVRICIALLAIGCAYAAIFCVWWVRLPRTAQTVDGRTVWLVEISSDHRLPGGDYLWYPAFWTLQHVFAYQPVGFAVETDRDVGYWARNPPDEWLRILHGQVRVTR
jgi:hypothetical protein